MSDHGSMVARVLSVVFSILAILWLTGAFVIAGWIAFHPPVTHHGTLNRENLNGGPLE